MLVPLIMFYFALVGFFSFGLTSSELPESKVSIQANATADFFLKYTDAMLTYCEVNSDRCINDVNSFPVSQFLSKESRGSELIIASAIYSCKVAGYSFVFSSPTNNYIPRDNAYQNEMARHLTTKMEKMESVVYVGENIQFNNDLNRCGFNLNPYHTILVIK